MCMAVYMACWETVRPGYAGRGNHSICMRTHHTHYTHNGTESTLIHADPEKVRLLYRDRQGAQTLGWTSQSSRLLVYIPAIFVWYRKRQ